MKGVIRVQTYKPKTEWFVSTKREDGWKLECVEQKKSEAISRAEKLSELGLEVSVEEVLKD